MEQTRCTCGQQLADWQIAGLASNSLPSPQVCEDCAEEVLAELGYDSEGGYEHTITGNDED